MMYQNNDYHTYSYEGYGGNNASEFHGQKLYPEMISAPTLNQNSPKEKKPKKAPRIIAAALGMALIAGGAGGGAAWYVVSNYQPAAAASSGPDSPTVRPTVVSGTTTDISSVVQMVSGSVVEIDTSASGNPFRFEQTMEGAGSGVIVSEDGYIVTNNHVVEHAQDITVRTLDGTEYPATLVGADESTDLAVLKVEATGLTPVTYADSDSAQVGELSIVIGNPLGQLGGTVTSGIISATSREITIGSETMHLLQTSAAVNPGNSGGGLFDKNGNLVGVVNAKSSGVDIEGLGFAIPSNTVKEVVNDIIENGYVTGRPQFGISVIEVSDPYTMAMYRLSTPGVYIASDNNPTGLQAGDRIVRIESEEITTSAQISGILGQHKVGDTLTMAVVRDGREHTVQITLTEKVPESAQTVQNEL